MTPECKIIFPELGKYEVCFGPTNHFGMSAERWKALTFGDEDKLTPEELAEGWHWCCEFDGLLIHPRSPEMEFCKCFRDDRFFIGCIQRRSKGDGIMANQINAILDEVTEEMFRAKDKFPLWPSDPLHAIAVIGEEFGELTQATLQCTYEPNKSDVDDVQDEAIQCMAMLLRFMLSIDEYEFEKSEQHKQ
jgi:NTP pyrophosphatase (non-canonical NTP hydrolase)